MKNMRYFFRYSPLLITAMLLTASSCKNHKNPSLSENALISQIQVQQNQEVEREKEAQKLCDSLARLPKGFQYKEVRSVDPDRPPVVFHFTDSLPQKEFKLSEIADQLEYIVLKPPLDSTLFLGFTRIIMGADYIVCYGIQGIELFDRKGNYIKTIVKNQGLTITNGVASGYSMHELVGLPFMKISTLDNTFLYTLLDGPANQVTIMKVDPALLNIEKTETDKTSAQNPAQGTSVQRFQRTDYAFDPQVYQLKNGLWASLMGKWTSGSNGHLLTIYGPTGDTLCQFKDYDRIVNYPGGPYRNTDKEFSYHFNKLLSFKPAHNDTLFRVIPPNRLLPAYVFDFGSRKVGLMEGLISTKDLSQKNLCNELFETNRYLFFVYTRNHVVGKAYRSGNYRYFYTLFDKKSNQIYHLSSIKTSEGGMVNDLDDGPPFWPDGVNEEGIPYMWCTGQKFKKQSVSKRIKGLADHDAVIILAK